MIRTLGVIGGGQLGRYFVLEAQALGFETVVFDPDPLCPAGQVADHQVCAQYSDLDAIRTFCTKCEIATVEFENIPIEALHIIEKEIGLRPSSTAIGIAANRIQEKQFLSGLGLEVAPFQILETSSDVERLMSSKVSPTDNHLQFVLKTATLGYDGKGQVRVSGLHNLAEAWAQLQGVPCVLESFVDFDSEISVIVARTATGEISTFTPTLNVHVNGVLDHTVTVAESEITSEARRFGEVIAEKLQYVGVLGVEFFVAKNRLIVNEFAPRPHNSGHWTLSGATTSQFGQQVRALAGLALGDTQMEYGAVAMANVLGDLWASGEPNWSRAEQDERVSVHLYGKHEPRIGRKMGHLTAVADDAQTAVRLALDARDSVIRH